MSVSNCKVSGCENKIISRSSILCSSHHNKELRDKRRKYAINYLGGKCNLCKKQSDRYEFDHIKRESVSFRIAVGLAFNINRLNSELDKCQLLCRKCHVIKTNNDLGRGSKLHGNHSTYTNKNCRCELCTKAWSKYVRERRAVRSNMVA